MTNLHWRLGWILTGLVLTTLGVRCCAAEEAGISARHHSWARFRPGAWKLVRVVTESLDESNHVLSVNVTETKTSLSRIDADGVVLEVEVGVEVAGKQFDGQPQCLKQGFHGELAGGDVKLYPAMAAEISLDGQKIPCRSQQVEVAGPVGRTSVNLFFSDTLAPYVLRRQSKTTDADGTNVLSDTLSEVVAFDMPQRVLRRVEERGLHQDGPENSQRHRDHLGDVVARRSRRRGFSDDEGNGPERPSSPPQHVGVADTTAARQKPNVPGSSAANACRAAEGRLPGRRVAEIVDLMARLTALLHSAGPTSSASFFAKMMNCLSVMSGTSIERQKAPQRRSWHAASDDARACSFRGSRPSSRGFKP